MKTSKPLRKTSPVRFRPMVTALVVVTAFIAIPLLLVWKQAYISSASMTIEKMNDTLSTMNREIASLRIVRERLADYGRIESIARSVLALEYPSSDRITIVSARSVSNDGSSALLLSLRERVKKGGAR